MVDMQTESASDPFEAVYLQSRGYLRSVVLQAAFELGVPSLLNQKARSLEELQCLLGVAPHRLESMIALLCFEDLVQPLGQLGDVVRYRMSTVHPAGREDLAVPWEEVIQVYQRNRPICSSGSWRAYQRHLAELAERCAPEVYRRCFSQLSGAVIDVGGGIGIYMAEILERNRAAEGLLIERKPILGAARQRLSKFGNRCGFACGDFEDLHPQQQCNAVLMSNLLHLYGPGKVRRLVDKACEWLAPSGKLVVKEIPLGDSEEIPGLSTYFNLNLSLYTEEGRLYPVSFIVEVMEGAGFQDIEVMQMSSAPSSVLVSGCLSASGQTAVG